MSREPASSGHNVVLISEITR